MEPTFNLTGLKKIYNESLRKKEQTLVFEIKHGKGLFNFLMFFSDDDIESKDKLYLFLRRTNTVTELKLYGNHRNGDFKIYINGKQKELIIKELDLIAHDGTFDFNKFLEELNNAIPNALSLESKINNLKEIWPNIKNKIPNILDESDKTILVGTMKLPPNKHPQERTLRKLYLFVNGDVTTLAGIINNLKSRNMTLVWTSDKKKKESSIADFISQLT